MTEHSNPTPAAPPSSAAPSVLVIDDDVRLGDLLATYLGQNGFAVTQALDGVRGLARLEGGSFDVVLLDVMMPGIDGLEVCRRIRARSEVPVIMLTAKGDETDRVVGLELGADDYLPKPFSPRELLARVRAVLRRTLHLGQDRLEVRDVVVDLGTREVHRAGALIDLTGIEFDILVALVRRAGRVIPREALLREAGRADVTVGERTVDVHISHLRQKLGDDGDRGVERAAPLIRTVRGIGYVFVQDDREV